jgi:hypothetical protein
MTKAFTTKESKVIKTTLGDGYGDKLYRYLRKHKVVKSKNVPTAIGYIYQIVNGQKKSRLVQEKILDLVEEELRNQALVKKRRKILLG